VPLFEFYLPQEQKTTSDESNRFNIEAKVT